MFKIILANFHLEKILWIVKTKIKYMIMAALVCAAVLGGFAFLTQKSTYRAKISFYVYSNPDYVSDTGVNISSSDISSAKQLLNSYMQIINSDNFLQQVIDTANLSNSYSIAALRSEIHAEAVEGTAVFYVTVYDSDAVNAMNIANAIGKLAPDKVISIVKAGGIEVLDSAALPTVPYQSTSVIKYAALGGGAGFIIAAFVCILRGLCNTVVRRKYEIEDLFTIPILGEVPQIEPKEGETKVNVYLNDKSEFTYKEAYNNIRTNLLFTSKGQKCPVYAFTSADTFEGKSMNIINTGIAYAQVDKKVLVIDADMRKSAMAERLGYLKKEGLSEYLAGITDQLVITHMGNGIDVVFSGSMPPNPSELLMSEKWKEILDEYKKKYDVILVDLPPLGIVSDALALVDQATGYIIVVRENVTHFERTELVVRKLEPLNANICGIIYNGISMSSPDYRYKSYGKEYVRTEEQK